MILALLLGLCFYRLHTHERLKPGTNWTSRELLYIGVALLGLRIDVSDLSTVSPASIALVIIALALTICAGLVLARLLKEDRDCGLLMGCAVAICGVSAAAAVCSVMEDCEERDRQLAITVAGITGLSTLAMIIYPVVVQTIGYTAAEAGLFMGATIHNVSQAVGAGYSISNGAGDVTVVYKLLRVSMLLPVILCIVWLTTSTKMKAVMTPVQKLKAYFPTFLIVFIALAILSLLGWVPGEVTEIGNKAAKFCLVVSLVAIGMKTNLKDVVSHGLKPLLAMTLTTLFLAGFVMAGIAALA